MLEPVVETHAVSNSKCPGFQWWMTIEPRASLLMASAVPEYVVVVAAVTWAVEDGVVVNGWSPASSGRRESAMVFSLTGWNLYLHYHTLNPIADRLLTRIDPTSSRLRQIPGPAFEVLLQHHSFLVVLLV